MVVVVKIAASQQEGPRFKSTSRGGGGGKSTSG